LPAVLQTTFVLAEGNNCGGTLTVTTTPVNLSGVTLAGGASCTVVVGVIGVATGTVTNSAVSTSTQTGQSPLTATAAIEADGRRPGSAFDRNKRLSELYVIAHNSYDEEIRVVRGCYFAGLSCVSEHLTGNFAGR
jgi:hypothetical protein